MGDDVLRYLRARYAARKPDVVIAVGNSLELALAHRDELFADVPIVFANVDHRVEGKEMPLNVAPWRPGSAAHFRKTDSAAEVLEAIRRFT